MDPAFAAFALCVFVAFAAQALSGFGATVVALTLGAHLYPIEEIVPVVVPLSLVSAATIALRHRDRVDRALLARRILPLMGLGVAAGLALFEATAGARLERAYGALVVALAAVDLLGRARESVTGAGSQVISERTFVHDGCLVAAGVVHGLWGSGGPLLVHAVGRSGLDKAGFRSTVAAVWTALNLALTATYAAGGRLGTTALPRILALLPVVAVAVALGERAHERLGEGAFRRVTAVLLLAAGAALAA